MARIRTIKPEIARHELLFDVERATDMPIRFAWAMLPTICDREGRFKWRPAALKPDVLPYDKVDFGDLLDALVTHGFMVRYRVNDEWYGWLPTFTKHQFINNREAASELPGISEADEVIGLDATTSTRHQRVEHATQGEGKGREGKGDSSAPPRVAEPASPALLTFPTVGNGPRTWDLTEAQRAEWQAAYPGLDVLGECRRAMVWVQANQPKTATGMKKFLVNWLNRAVERGGNSRPFGQAGSGTSTVRTEPSAGAAARMRQAGVR